MKETDLCATFRTAAESDGWIVYPEVNGWDLVLVWSGEAPVPDGAPDIVAGVQVAVEAKLRANVDVLAQSITRSVSGGQARHRAVLVPKATENFRRVAGELDLGVYTLKHCAPWTYRKQYRELPRMTVTAPRYTWKSRKPLWLPPVVSNRPAGEPSPQALTPWRVQALKLMTMIRSKGFVTSRDFKGLGINPQIWRDQKWILPGGRLGRLTRYVLNMEAATALPDQGFEKERDAIERIDREVAE